MTQILLATTLIFNTSSLGSYIACTECLIVIPNSLGVQQTISIDSPSLTVLLQFLPYYLSLRFESAQYSVWFFVVGITMSTLSSVLDVLLIRLGKEFEIILNSSQRTMIIDALLVHALKKARENKSKCQVSLLFFKPFKRIHLQHQK